MHVVRNLDVHQDNFKQQEMLIGTNTFYLDMKILIKYLNMKRTYPILRSTGVLKILKAIYPKNLTLLSLLLCYLLIVLYTEFRTLRICSIKKQNRCKFKSRGRWYSLHHMNERHRTFHCSWSYYISFYFIDIIIFSRIFPCDELNEFGSQRFFIWMLLKLINP